MLRCDALATAPDDAADQHHHAQRGKGALDAPVVLRPHTRSSLTSTAYGVSCRARGAGAQPNGGLAASSLRSTIRPIRPNRAPAQIRATLAAMGPPLARALCASDSADRTTVRILPSRSRCYDTSLTSWEPSRHDRLNAGRRRAAGPRRTHRSASERRFRAPLRGRCTCPRRAHGARQGASGGPPTAPFAGGRRAAACRTPGVGRCPRSRPRLPRPPRGAARAAATRSSALAGARPGDPPGPRAAAVGADARRRLRCRTASR